MEINVKEREREGERQKVVDEAAANAMKAGGGCKCCGRMCSV
jgi:hypothetical protein